MRFFVLAATALALSACRSAPARPDRSPLVASEGTSRDEAVATVDGQPIGAAEVRAQAAATGTDARTALAALIDAELLVGEARRRGLNDDPAVAAAMRREMARRYLQSTFERDFTPADVGDQELRRAYLRVRARLDHPELRIVRHVLARVRKGDDETRKRALRQRAEQVAERARSVHGDVDAFVALGGALSDGNIKLEVEQVATSIGWENHSLPFRRAAYALNLGETSGVVDTEFGYDVMFYEQRIAEEHISYEEAKENLRTSLWPDLQRREFGRYLDGLVARHRVEEHASQLGLSDVGGDGQDTP
jgi:hypothetical protein